MIRLNAINGFQRPTDRDLKNLQGWIQRKKPLVAQEQDYILWKEDIWSLRSPNEGVAFEGFISSVLQKFQNRSAIQVSNARGAASHALTV